MKEFNVDYNTVCSLLHVRDVLREKMEMTVELNIANFIRNSKISMNPNH